MKKIKSFFLIICLMLFSNIYAQDQKSETDFRSLVQRHVSWYPLIFDDWEKNTNQYLGYYLKLTLKENKVIEAEFSKETPLIVVQRNEELNQKLSSYILEAKLSNIPDGMHVFPVICEMITIPKKELQNNLESELENMIPEPEMIHNNEVLFNKPILVKIYPPKR
ncbi:hypothetical protein PBT90_18935 [Algoriphagus halophytocola]|uniref:Uncharacterized protein n=1 Tax=Algoriphagus halophytocola TaxID=2991499 RepID=A0ABY6MDX9_9BACT|nr:MULTISPECIES: hypothetical protein [unclassified Algoriphagus]UZD21589.1 hypothetical protein OM944_13060 [Algoriphagus sp. TR-M5]WBL42802.1 hypothetical protein PBT90_18935 [Algoriphagus sp. TR-M9]